MIDVKLWSLDKDEKNNIIPSELESLFNTETEQQLEDLIVKNPNLLMERLKLVGRQTPTASGFLDLLGIDKDGYLVVFELKRGKLSRDAVTQVIDYSSYLADLDRDSLCEHISNRSGTNGIEKITDFESWYQENIGTDLELLDEPPKMILVGLGYDDNVKRMVNFLSDSNLNISLVTFYGFQKGEDTFLAKQVEVSLVESREIKKDSYNKVNNELALNDLIKKTDVEKLFSAAADMTKNALPSSYAWSGRTGRSFSLVERTDAGKPTNRVYAAIYLTEKKKRTINYFVAQRCIESNKEWFAQLLENNKQIQFDSGGNISVFIKESEWKHWEPLIRKILSKVYSTWEEQSKSI